jgi:uncharacterized protein YcnI
MKLNFCNLISALAALPIFLLVAADVRAHIVLEQKSATAGSYYKATFMVGHGCDGSPTTGMEIEMPEAMAVVKPMPKPGWQLNTQTAPLAVPMSLHGRTVTETVNRVTWRGGSLADGHYDEFVMLLQLPKRSGPLYFRVAQSCASGRSDWMEVPAADQAGRLKFPAPVLQLQPAAPVHHH